MDHLPDRKPTRLSGYDYSQANYYYVTICTDQRKNVLGRVVGGGVLDAPPFVGADAHIDPGNPPPVLRRGRCPHRPASENRSGATRASDAYIDPQVYLSPYGRIVERYIKTIPGIDKYVIMPNHVHLIIRIDAAKGPMWASAPTQSLSSRIRSFKTLVSKEIGRSLWQRSYYDHVIRNEADYLRIWQYIDENPAKWTEDEYYS